jgi:adenosylcobinamide kinase / adenosylcobinamide-phosphate guanylyltransferase
VAEHQARRPAGWRTVETDRQIGATLTELAAASQTQPSTVLVDDLGLLASNHLLALAGSTEPTRETARHLDAVLASEIDALVSAQQAGRWSLIVVTQEVGSGIVPTTPLGRFFRDGLGRANQRLAAAADNVFLLVAGLPLRLKPPCEHLAIPPRGTL